MTEPPDFEPPEFDEPIVIRAIRWSAGKNRPSEPTHGEVVGGQGGEAARGHGAGGEAVTGVAAGAEAASDQSAGGEAKTRLGELELELGRARRETERLRGELESAERKRREAEQLAHAEEAMRLDLERDHAARIRRHQAQARAAEELLQAAQVNGRVLAREIESLRRSADEARRPPAPLTPPASTRAEPPTSRALMLAAEMAIAKSAPPAPVAAVVRAPSETPGLRLELAVGAGSRGRRAEGRADTTEAVEVELTGALLRLAAEQAHADDLLAPGPEDDPARDEARAAYVSEALAGIARQLEAVRVAVALLPASQDAVPPPREDGGANDAADRAAHALAPDRLTAALDRLRQAYPPANDEDAAPAETGAEQHAAPGGTDAEQPAAPAEPGTEQPAAPSEVRDLGSAASGENPSSRWLAPALVRLLREDAALVGAVITRLLPAQALVLAGPLRYDLALSDIGCRSVSVLEGEVRLQVRDTPRALDAVDFRIEGDLAGLGRLILYRPLRRRLSRRVARVRGDRRALAGLLELVREPPALTALCAAGVQLDPEPVLRIVAHLIDPAWTEGERFTVGHESPRAGGCVYLHIRDRARPRVTREPPLGPVKTTLRSDGGQLLCLLAGAHADVEVRGASAPVALLREWIARAQRDS